MMAKTKRPAQNAWTTEEDAVLVEMKGRRNLPWSEIMFQLPRRTKCAAQLHWHFMQYPERKIRRPAKNPYTNNRMDYRLEREHAASRQRAALALAEHPELTGRICGDPIPGRSALDRRKAEAPAISLAGSHAP